MYMLDFFIFYFFIFYIQETWFDWLVIPNYSIVVAITIGKVVMFSIDNLFMLVHPFGWFIFTICAFVLVLLLYCSHKQILQCYQETLQPMWHSTSEAFHSLCDWVRHSFQLVWTIASRASIGSSMPTPNVVGPINIV